MPRLWEMRNRGRVTGRYDRRRVLILCEDEKSSRLYFEGFRIDRQRVEFVAVGTGFNTDTLVQEAIDKKRAGQTRGEPWNEVWCVFDRDSFPALNFNKAFELAGNNGIQIAWSNEAFELWYLMHFHYCDTGMSRRDYGSRLSGLMGCSYEKADAEIYAKLVQKQQDAIRNARRLEKHWSECGGCNPEKSNPSTNVHKLVEFLNKLASLGPA